MQQIVIDKQDMTYLMWSKVRNSSGTAGSFLKSYSDLGEKKLYYKLSNFDSQKGIVGHESVNEIIVDRLLTKLGVEHLNYRLIYVDIIVNEKKYETWICESEDFKKSGDSKIALDEYYELEHMDGETPMDFCCRMGWQEYIYEMLVVDYLIMNRDRHGANIEVLKNNFDKTIRLAPLFDHGLSLLYQCQTKEQIMQVDINQEKRVQCFFADGGTTLEHLQMIPKGCYPKFQSLKESDRKDIFKDLDQVLDQELIDKIWEMIWTRWCYYESLCNQK